MKAERKAAAVIVPLYIYPFPGAWDPLYEAINAYPNLKFTVIINPHNGPGIASPFDANYAREIPRLNACANVCTLGYVRTDYCRRPIAEVRADIETYGGGLGKGREGGVQGIFVDEVPNLYDKVKVEYLRAVDGLVRNTAGIQGRRMIIHNPGTVPDAEFAGPGPNATAIFEAGYTEYKSPAVQERISALLRYEQDRCVYLVHSVPAEEMTRLVLELRDKAGFIFATCLCGDFYVRFGPSWGDFVKAMQDGIQE